ncbi:hypothetical protein [Aerococcus viridans]|uniref:hypothetical protein n=1 Tax=Aerococcus viridans TaxID=1377 RepID=UPI002DB5E9E1|nr:hypothetical protein [Aerococcus viridans]MEC1386514.1 hypothetical protein [Aerococcus viridans]
MKIDELNPKKIEEPCGKHETKWDLDNYEVNGYALLNYVRQKEYEFATVAMYRELIAEGVPEKEILFKLGIRAEDKRFHRKCDLEKLAEEIEAIRKIVTLKDNK